MKYISILFSQLKVKSLTTIVVLLAAIMPSTHYFNELNQSNMAFHMLFQLPMLILAGYMLYEKKFKQYLLIDNVAMWLWIYFSGLFWMLPISLDKALINPSWDVFKIISLLITGALLKVVLNSYRILSLFFIGSTVMMLFFVGIYFQTTENRLCNAYLIESQQITGYGLIILAFLILIALLFFLVKADES